MGSGSTASSDETMINLGNLNFLDWDYPAIYEGVMSPENNFIMIIQNFWMTVTSSIGYIFLIPFFERPPVPLVKPFKPLTKERGFIEDVENFSFDYNTVYVGVMSPEENMIVILQNVLMFIYSSIGYVMLLPFYQVRIRRRWECDSPLGDFLCSENDR